MIKYVKDEKDVKWLQKNWFKSLFSSFSTKIVEDFEMKNQNVINRHKITKTAILNMSPQAWRVMAFDVEWNKTSIIIRHTTSFDVKIAWREHYYTNQRPDWQNYRVCRSNNLIGENRAQWKTVHRGQAQVRAENKLLNKTVGQPLEQARRCNSPRANNQQLQKPCGCWPQRLL